MRFSGSPVGTCQTTDQMPGESPVWRSMDHSNRYNCALGSRSISGGVSIACVFTDEQIEELHGRLGRVETLADYIRSLAELGVVRYDSYVSDGHSEYLGLDGRRVISQPAHDELSVAVDSDGDAFLDQLSRHERGETSYLEMSRGVADSGVERWTVDTREMTMTYYSRSGEVMLAEQIT